VHAELFGDIDPGMSLLTGEYDHNCLPVAWPLPEFEQAAVDNAINRRGNFVPRKINNKQVPARRGLFDRLFGLCEFLDRGAA